MIRFGTVLTVVLVAMGLLVAGVLTGSLLLVYLAIGVAVLAAVLLSIGVVIWRGEVFGGSPAVERVVEQPAGHERVGAAAAPARVSVPASGGSALAGTQSSRRGGRPEPAPASRAASAAERPGHPERVVRPGSPTPSGRPAPADPDTRTLRPAPAEPMAWSGRPGPPDPDTRSLRRTPAEPAARSGRPGGPQQDTRSPQPGRADQDTRTRRPAPGPAPAGPAVPGRSAPAERAASPARTRPPGAERSAPSQPPKSAPVTAAASAPPAASAGVAQGATRSAAPATAASASPPPAAPQAPAVAGGEKARPRDPGAEVSVVPGIARYHRGGCILIRFLGAGDLETMTRRDAEETGCVPCKACRPEQELAAE